MSLLQIARLGPAVVIKLDDPKRRNVLSLELCQALSAATTAAEDDPDVKAIIITGEPPAFCAGANLEDLKAAAAGDTVNLRAVYQSFMDVAQSRLPTIAAVNGAAIGAGMNLALACDVRIASETAFFDPRFLQIGLHPGGGHTWLLLRAIGWSQATRMLLLGKQVGAEEALQIGLVQSVVSASALLGTAMESVQLLSSIPRELLLATKATLRLATASTHFETFAHETQEQLRSLDQPAFQTLITRLKTNLSAH